MVREGKLKRSAFIFLGICIVVILMLIMAHIYTYYLIDSNADGIVKLSSFKLNGKEDSFDYRLLKVDDPKVNRFTTTIFREKLKNKINGSNY